MSKGRPSKKQSILDVAHRLFANNGYQGTSIDLVVREASVSKPTVYNNFPSKQVLFQELVIQQHAKLTDRLALLTTQQKTITQKLHQIFKQVVEQPFEIIIFRIFYGEPQKLDEKSLLLCRDFERQITDGFNDTLNALNLTETQNQVIYAVYKNTLLINFLNSTVNLQTLPNSYELEQQIKVLGIDNLS
jgi:AcrR family transcriptional regulator